MSSYGLRTVLYIASVEHIRDIQCGFKLFSQAAARALFPQLSTWIFDAELLLLAKTLQIPVARVPVTWHEVAGCKLSVVRDSLQVLRDLLVSNSWAVEYEGRGGETQGRLGWIPCSRAFEAFLYLFLSPSHFLPISSFMLLIKPSCAHECGPPRAEISDDDLVVT